MKIKLQPPRDYINIFLVSLPIVVLLIIVLLPFLNRTIKAPVRADAIGYYSYLPAIFNKKDLSFKYMINSKYLNNRGENSYEERFPPDQAEQTGFHYIENTDKYLDKYPIGEAILLLPFFITGHLLTIIYHYDQSGYSYFYQYLCVFGGIVYFSLGMYLLKKFLQKYFFKQIVINCALVLIFLATNLLNYSTYENLFSHIYSFFLVAALLNTTQQWFQKRNIRSSITLGINLSFILLLRQINIIFILIPLLYGVTSIKGFINQIKKYINNYKYCVVVALTAFIIFLPQLLYWKYSTGSWFLYSYKGEGFSLQNTHFIESLFSITRGLFIWSPILIFGVIGVFLLKGELKKYRLAILVSLILQWVIVSTWSSWTFGWGFGHRIFVDSLPLFSLGIANFIDYLFNIKLKQKRIIVYTSIIIFTGLAFLSIFQTTQYWVKILPPDTKDIEDYKKIFLQIDPKLINYWREKYRLDN